MKKLDTSEASATFSGKGLALAAGQGQIGKKPPAQAPFPMTEPRDAAGQEKAAKPKPEALSEALSLSQEARELVKGEPMVATTIDAGAPAGSGKRLSAYGEAQKALAPKGGGFDQVA